MFLEQMKTDAVVAGWFVHDDQDEKRATEWSPAPMIAFSFSGSWRIRCATGTGEVSPAAVMVACGSAEYECVHDDLEDLSPTPTTADGTSTSSPRPERTSGPSSTRSSSGATATARAPAACSSTPTAAPPSTRPAPVRAARSHLGPTTFSPNRSGRPAATTPSPEHSDDRTACSTPSPDHEGGRRPKRFAPACGGLLARSRRSRAPSPRAPRSRMNQGKWQPLSASVVTQLDEHG